MGTGNSHVRFYDVTSWSYVNLDDPVCIQPTVLAAIYCEFELNGWEC